MHFLKWVQFLVSLHLTFGCRHDIRSIDQDLQEYWLNEFRTAFLTELNLNSVPVVDPESREILRKQLKNIDIRDIGQNQECADQRSIRNRRDIQIDQDYSSVVEQIIPASINNPNKTFSHNLMRSYFSVNSLRTRPKLEGTLDISTRPDPDGGNYLVHIYEFINGNEIEARPLLRGEFNASQTLVSVDITAIVGKWIGSPSENFGLMVKAEQNGMDIIDRTLDNMDRTWSIQLDITFSTLISNSVPRIAVPTMPDVVCSWDERQENCCRYPFTINLTDMFPFILKPEMVNVHACVGRCPLGLGVTSINARLRQQLGSTVTNEQGRQINIEPCCVPTVYQGISVLYMLQNNSMQTIMLTNVFPLRCGCS